MQFETKHLLLRPWTEADAEDLYLYASDPDIGPIAGWPAHRSVEESRISIRKFFSVRPHAYAVCLKSDNRPIGAIELKMGEHTDLTEKDDECELGYWIGKPFWGQGLIPEAARVMLHFAFEDLGMTKVFCAYYDGNEKSKRVQEKLGFTHQWTTEGIELPLLNEVRTGHVNAMTKAEWLGLIA
ncbi:GNAT family N-acetyltransferase [Boudabousia liubingyangii]|uniref:GNAT family N-acetyltransferase n=1 Tax=Boudabousia liubingyangii TaxID=1921764 RepID=A0A1Q5PLJ0_9ACTO|nr:GNAT family N-acetyltransferase [Boudabousia liubingyangii]OKL47918.1 GNAT family N-acetyltransferase [Boudabousia liubingyangii]